MNRNTFKTFAFLLTGLIMVACGNNIETNLNGKIDCDKDSIIIKSIMLDRTEISTDTVALNDGEFKINIKDSEPVWINITPMASNEVEKKNLFATKILMLPGDKISLSGALDDLNISGSKLYDALKDTEYYKVYKENDALRREIARVYRSVTDETRSTLDSLLDKSQEMDKRLNEAALKIVKEQPNNIAAGFATLKMFDKDCIEAIGELKDNVINGPLKKVIESNVEAKKKSLDKQKKWDSIVTGMQAPNFNLKDINGKEKSLTSFKGKYVVLEFWGTWCPWCIKGLPLMRTYYAKYKSNVEFVSISCRDTDEAWRKCIEKYDLRWTQLFNGDDKEILKDYGILGFPSKIIIDKDGKIVEKFLDEEPTFYQKLDELLG